MQISTVSIIGEGELVPKLQELLSKAGFKVVTSGLKGDYTKQMVDVDLVLEVAPEDIAVKKKVQRH